MVPAAVATLSIVAPAPMNVAVSPRRTSPCGVSVMSMQTRSMEMRPANGQRLPATTAAPPPRSVPLPERMSPSA
jgi:hypothetical protein